MALKMAKDLTSPAYSTRLLLSINIGKRKRPRVLSWASRRKRMSVARTGTSLRSTCGGGTPPDTRETRVLPVCAYRYIRQISNSRS